MSLTLTLESVTRPTSADVIKRISLTTAGGEADGQSNDACLSLDGRFVVFTSTAPNLGSGGLRQIFRKDLISGEVTLVSGDTAHAPANAQSFTAAVSQDGRYVVFTSAATNLVAGVSDGTQHVFRKDMMTGTIELVSATGDAAPAAANKASNDPQISADGNYVLFSSAATNLVPGDVTGFADIFRKNLATGEIVLVSADQAHTQANGSSAVARMSADGRFVVFESAADNLVAGDVNATTDIFRKDVQTGEIVLVSAAADGTHTQLNQSSSNAQISLDGRYVVFTSRDSNLVAGDTNGVADVFRKDLATGEIVLVSTAGDAAHTQGTGASDFAQISADGRYVTFSSAATDLVEGDTNGVTDVFHKDLLTGDLMRLTSTAPAQGHVEANRESFAGSLSADGRFAIFHSAASNLVSGTAAGEDIFLNDLTTGEITLVSRGLQPGGGQSLNADINADGRYAVFESFSFNLASPDVNNTKDIFRKDLVTGEVILVSTAGNAAHTQADRMSTSAKISANGQYVLFQSAATNLVAGDALGFSDIFRKDLSTGDLVLVSAAANGTAPGNGDSSGGEMTFDGKYAVFSSRATDIVAGDANGVADVFWRDLTTGQVRLVSQASDATQGNLASIKPHVSAFGTYVVFESSSSTLVLNDTNATTDIFRKNVLTGDIVRVSTAGDAAHTQGNADSHNARISADGRYVVFESKASNLVTGDTNNVPDIFVKDLDTGEIIRVSTAADAAHTQGNWASSNAKFSNDGRYVIFESFASNFVAGDTNGGTDIFRKDLVTGEIIRLSETNIPAEGLEQATGEANLNAFSSDGRYLVIDTSASNLVAGDTNRGGDIFLADAELMQNAQAVAEQRFLKLSLAVDAASSAVTVAWGDGSISAVQPVAGRASFSHVYDSTGLKAATVSVHDGALTWTVPYEINLTSGQMTRNTALPDTISGGAGNDSLVGDAGANILIGNGGNDSYVVNDLRDVVRETVGGGFDTVTTSVSFALASDAEIEIVMAAGAAPLSLTGNASANTLNGNAAANRIAGGDGTDTLRGLSGNDALLGDFGNDRLYGSSGKDILTGGNGRDIFVFDTRANKTSNLDKITDFSVRDDTIWLENTYFKVGKGSASKPTKMSKKMFWSGTSAHDADDRIIYNKKNGVLSYDGDGTGGRKAVEIAVLKKNLKMTDADFYVI
ncbi:hypothetical protein [Microvirga brassicacearum]|uniref:Calcium-binding protein n=1 Tax=Microvirga brassicacearum TaxID=2580413 RepID=A0A5N3P8Q5_9HYPH|nr:hypothetical protein [Microvirga brassicacearum]KAB0266055.1 hypothetical protein FEZ63_14935 [Microvirga brassicacearum]